MSEAQGITTQAVVPSGASVSAGVKTQGKARVGVYFPAALTGATIAFDVSEDGAAWSPYEKSDGSGDYVLNFAASDFVPVPFGDVWGPPWIRVRCPGGNQAAQRTFTLEFRNA